MADKLELALKRAFIDQEVKGSLYDPHMILNDPENHRSMLKILQDELDSCDGFFFSVAFLTQDGLAALKTHLADLHARGVTGSILTSDYLAFNHPDVFEDLLNIPNVEVRISEKKGFHSKGYLFKQEGYHSFIIGSSNLTMSALKINYEWNIRLTSYDHGKVIQDMRVHMEKEWAEARQLNQNWIQQYRKTYQPLTLPLKKQSAIASEVKEGTAPYIVPNKMQQAALANLKALREEEIEKALVVSATGTGKTYLSAFDVQEAQPERMLFIVHREQILKKAKVDFQMIVDGPDEDFGILSGNSKDWDAKYLFATIQTIAKEEVLQTFAKDHFEYVLIDEVHKAGAQSYRRVLNHFEPDFLLGMTATPERTDGFNIFELFDYNVAYEIRLQEALEEDMLCPFHYFGVTDYTKDGEMITETTELNRLVEEERVDYLFEKLDYYGCSGNVPKGLVFCSRKQEAETLAELFSAKGRPSTYLAGDHSIEEREKEVRRLENGEIQYIFTVDIFNEGIDIPKINQVVMLRNTQSNIIFVQQLGRGLRKHPSKEFVTVIDFIGNYKNNYMIPMALTGDVSRNKNNLRKDTFDTNFISGVSSVNFEEIAKKQIFTSINEAKLDSMAELKKAFELLFNRLGRVPYLRDFAEQHTIDPLLIANKKSKESYYNFLLKMKKNEGTVTPEENNYLMSASREFMSGMRRQELVLLKVMMENPGRMYSIDEIRGLFQQYDLLSDETTILSVLNSLSFEFFAGSQAQTYEGCALIERENDRIRLSAGFKKALKNEYFEFLMNDILTTGWLKAQHYDRNKQLTRYQKYKRRDVLRLLNWKKQMVDQNIGGYTSNDDNGEFVIFVTLKKGDDFSGALMAYEDELMDPSTMKWFTKSPRTIKSPEVLKLKNPENWTFRLFVKKSDDEGVDFYYLGKVQPEQDTIHEVEKPVKNGEMKKVVQMLLKFDTPMDEGLFRYLTTE